MKKLVVSCLLTLLTFFLSLPARGQLTPGPQRVDGYTRQNGTYIQPHYRTSPNATRTDNWSTRGNTNPYTGQPGYRNPYANPQPNQQPSPARTRHFR